MLLIYWMSNAQNNMNGCGTYPNKEYWETIDAIDPIQRAQFPSTEVVKYVPIKIFNVAKNDGTGAVSLTRILNMMCFLNTRYAPTGIKFYLLETPTLLYNSIYYSINDQSVADQMMNLYNRDNICNLYICDISALGLCGYAYFPGQGPGPNNRAKGGIVLSNSCVEGTTLPHEMGHYLSLPHPFDGTSGFPSSPSSEYVTRNPNDTLNGRHKANCWTAGDRFCDTESDFIGNRWACPYTGAQRDYNGDLFQIDPTLYMCYSLDNCQSRFSPNEISAMQYCMVNQRSYLSNWPQPTDSSLAPFSTLNLIPTNTQLNIPRNFVRFNWTSTGNATSYLIQISGNTSFSNVTFETIVTDTTYLYTGQRLTEGNTYLWRVRPISKFDYCGGNSAYTSFVAGRGYGIGNQEIDKTDWNLYPNPSLNGSATLIFSNRASRIIRILSLNGTEIIRKNVPIWKQEEELETLTKGIYLVEVIENGMVSRKKWVIE